MEILRGAFITESLNQLQTLLDKHLNASENEIYGFTKPQLSIGGVRLPPYLETLGIFAIGSPGTGKSQAVTALINQIRQRPDFRLVCFDRNGEFTQKFYQEGKDLLFNPTDKRSVKWCHTAEPLRYETIAAGIVPEDDHQNKFWAYSARALLSDIYSRCKNNAEVWACISKLDMQELEILLKGTPTSKTFGSEKTISSIVATLTPYSRFYKELPNKGNFSFYNWALNGTQSLFLPLFEDAAEIYKPLYTVIFELILRGILSSNRDIKTAVVIDELGALNRLDSLPRLLSEGRKFKVCPILATQTEAQILKTYGTYDSRIILQGLATKLILNCRDPKTAITMSEVIGKQERIEDNSNNNYSQSSSIRETFAVLPTELQYLPPLTGYLSFSNEVGVGKVQVIPQTFTTLSKAFIPRRKLNDKRFNKAKQDLVERYNIHPQHKPLPVDAYEGFF